MTTPAPGRPVALVTGSTQGIGEAIARAHAAAGTFVIVHGRDATAGERLAAEIDGLFVAADLSSVDGVRTLATAVRSATGRLDLLVNNAGFELHGPLGDVDVDTLACILFVNLQAPVLLTQELLPLIEPVRGTVQNITSIHDDVPAFGNLAYASAKAGLHMFTKSASVELGPRGIRVNTIAPGAIETAMNREILDEVGRDQFAEWIPLGRVGTTEDVAAASVFLASSAAAYISGAHLTIDGAYSHHLVRYRLSDDESDTQKGPQ